ncbi:MAG TPA: chemotaxis protein CheW [Methanoregulaceae archaeon]|nr:chemotaxis protein CheW [Methanoregulaceae archaeon]
MAPTLEGRTQDTASSPTLQGAETRSGNIQVVIFTLGEEQFAIDLFDVKEVVEYTTITKLPNVQSYIKGIIDLRGEITTIVDLKQRLNITATRTGTMETSRIIVLDETITASKIGILVDDVTSVTTFEAERVDYTSASINKGDTGIIGIIKKNVKIKEKECNELIIWIDIKQLLSDIDSALLSDT